MAHIDKKGKLHSFHKRGAGKSDRPRPVDKKKYDKNYEKIFRKANEQRNTSHK